MPKFCIIVPTRNRSANLKLTLAGLVQQTYHDFSIVVSDNSDEKAYLENQKTIAFFNKTHPIRHIRPDKVLNMVDHWNFAVGYAEGEYVGFITDRLTLISNALQVISCIVNHTGAACITYNGASLQRFLRHFEKPEQNGPIIVNNINPREMLSDFSLSNLTPSNPRFLNSFIITSELEVIKSKYGTVFSGISPDYSFLFRALVSISGKFTYTNERLLIDHSPEVSNGMALARFKPNVHSEEFVNRIKVDQAKHISVGPIPGEMLLLTNSILREYEIVRADAEIGLMPEINPQKFYNACAKDLYSAEKVGSVSWLNSLKLLNEYRQSNGIKKITKFQIMALRATQARKQIKRIKKVLLTVNKDSKTTYIDIQLKKLQSLLSSYEEFYNRSEPYKIKVV